MRLACGIAAVVLLTGVSAPTADPVADLLGRVPDRTNAALIVDALRQTCGRRW